MKLIVVACILFSINSYSQTDSLKWINEINEHVWKPFIASFNNRDTKAFNSLHSKNLVRVHRDSKTITGSKHNEPEISEEEKKRRANWTASIEFRFTERIHSENKAFETGYYKTVFINKITQENRTNFAKFMVILCKEKAFWKILVDADGKENTTEAIFLTGKPLE